MVTGRVRVYICHRSTDAAWAEKLARDLRSKGIHAWLDQWDMSPGKPLSDAMQDGIMSSDAMIVVLTRESVQAVREGKGGVAFEVHVGEGRRYRDTGFKIIGVRREDCDPPEKLRNRIGRWLDFRSDGEYAVRFEELVGWLTGAPVGPPVEAGTRIATVPQVLRPSVALRTAAVSGLTGGLVVALILLAMPRDLVFGALDVPRILETGFVGACLIGGLVGGPYLLLANEFVTRQRGLARVLATTAVLVASSSIMGSLHVIGSHDFPHIQRNVAGHLALALFSGASDVVFVSNVRLRQILSLGRAVVTSFVASLVGVLVYEMFHIAAIAWNLPFIRPGRALPILLGSVSFYIVLAVGLWIHAGRGAQVARFLHWRRTSS